MKIIMLSEGARVDMGGLGLVAVPRIARALAGLGHTVTLEMFGPPIPGSESYVKTVPGVAFRENLVAISYPARGRYALSPSALPHVWGHVGRADFVMLHSLYSFAVLVGYAAARAKGIKYGVWPHGVLAPFQRTISPARKAMYDRLFAHRILNDASVIFYSAVGERDEAAELGLTAPSVIIPHGIDTPDSYPRGAFRKKYLDGFDGVLSLYLGRLNAKKGLDLLVQAFKQVHASNPKLRLALVGAGDPPEFAAQLDGWVREAGLDNVIVMPGLLTGDAKMQALADADLFVLPSHQENFSFAMFEALAVGIPVIISKSLNFAPQVERYRAGRVVERTPDAFAAAMRELSESAALRQELGKGGPPLAARYDWSVIGKQMEQVIQAILANQSLPQELVLGQVLS